MNGRLLRSKRQYQNKLKAELDGRIARKKHGSKRRKKLIRTKQKQLRKMKNQIKDVEHKLTSKLICTLQREGVQRLVIGDVRSIRKDLDVGSTNNQKLHQWSFGSVRHKLTYKGERAGMRVILQEERDTSRSCPVCGRRRKSKPRGRVFSCTNKKCKWSGHRDAVGAMNIRYKYRGEFGSPHVVGGLLWPGQLYMKSMLLTFKILTPPAKLIGLVRSLLMDAYTTTTINGCSSLLSLKKTGIGFSHLETR
jgi:putative transposase